MSMFYELCKMRIRNWFSNVCTQHHSWFCSVCVCRLSLPSPHPFSFIRSVCVIFVNLNDLCLKLFFVEKLNKNVFHFSVSYLKIA